MDKRWLAHLPTLRILAALGVMGLVAAPLGLSIGCKPASCESVCESMNECEGATSTPDCSASCDQAIQSALQAGCTDEYNSLLSCQGTIDICSSDTFCTAQSATYFTCVNDACSADPSKCSGS